MNRPPKPTPRKRPRQTLAFLRDREPSDTQIGITVFGPYKDRDKWRLIVLEGTKRKSVIASSADEAERIKAKLGEAITARADRTIGESLPEYEAYLTTERGAMTAAERRRQLVRFLGEELTLTGVTPKRAAELYSAEVARITIRGKPSAAAAHRTYLAEAKRFFKWAASRGYVSANPFADVRPIGCPKVGKTQLRIDEARRFVEVAMNAAESGDKLALAALLALMLGARASEVLHRLARDVDDGASILWIPHGKTKNAKRRLMIPWALRPLVAKLAEGKAPEAYLFAKQRDESKPYSDSRLWMEVAELCSRAGVPRVCTHSLRGLHATLSVRAGVSSEHVAASLGHSSFAITAKHYADSGAIANRNTDQVTSALFGAKPSVQELVRQASALTPPERDELRTALEQLRVR